MATKGVERLKERVKNNPLYYRVVGEKMEIRCSKCLAGEVKGWKKMPLYRIANYGTNFSVCDGCKSRYSAL